MLIANSYILVVTSNYFKHS